MNLARKLDIVSNELPAPPYPSDVRAKGWQFQLDVERIENSDTWLLAPKDMRPWLLLLWMKSWTQAPCGSLPANDELIAARIDMDSRVFAGNRDILMRGWYRAADGRLYHPVITEMVEHMRDGRRKEREKKAAQRAAEKQALSGNVPGDSDGTPGGLPGDSGGSPPTGTGTGTGPGTVSGTGTGVDPAAAGAARAKPKVERGTRLAKDWQLPKTWGLWAVSQGYAEADVRIEAKKFRNYWVAKSGKDATKLDWEATWENWMLGSKCQRAGGEGTGSVQPKETVAQYQARMAAERAAAQLTPEQKAAADVARRAAMAKVKKGVPA